MTAPDLVAAPFAATAYFAGPASLTGPASTRLTPEAMRTSEGNRWSAPGEPTIYLAGDLGVALAEFGRHAPPDQVDARVWSVRIELGAVADLRARREPSTLLDREQCRALAAGLRRTGDVEGVLVPTVAMLDRPDRWNLVVFADRVRRPLAEAIRPVEVVTLVRPAAAPVAAPAR